MTIDRTMQIATFVIMVTGPFILWVARKWVQQEIAKVVHRDVFTPAKEEILAAIEAATYPIQPGANGGKSLPDVAKLTQEIKEIAKELREEQVRIGERTANIDGALKTHLDWHNSQ